MTNTVSPKTPYVVNWTRQNADRLTRFCSAGVEQFASKDEAFEAANRAFAPLVISVMVRHFDLNTVGVATLLATRKRGKKLVVQV